MTIWNPQNPPPSMVAQLSNGEVSNDYLNSFQDYLSGQSDDSKNKIIMALLSGMMNSQAFYNPTQKGPAFGQGMAQTGQNAMQMMFLKKLLGGGGQ
jgi:hypothetical protein